MRTLQKSDFLTSEISYEPAALKEWSTGWQIEYRIFNPNSLKLEKVRIRFEKIRKRLGSDAKTRKHAKLYCDAITAKLASGWSPYAEQRNAKTFHTLYSALESFLNYKEQDLKNGVFRADSMRTYKSQVTMLKSWIKTRKMENIQVIRFDKNYATEYLDWVYMEKGLAARSWNNYVVTLRTIWNWMIEKNYCIENPFLKIRTKPKQEKTRVIIPQDWIDKIIPYFAEHEPNMIIVCGLVYNSFMRPSEICKTQIEDIQIDQNGIYLKGTKTKNKKSRWCLLPPTLVNRIKALHLENYSPQNYLFSTDLRPGKKLINTRDLDRYFSKMRNAIELPAEMQLYSFRDTGITEMKKEGHSNYFISSITGHTNSNEIETYTHKPNPEALKFVVSEMKCF